MYVCTCFILFLLFMIVKDQNITETWVSEVSLRNGFKENWTRLLFIFCQSFGIFLKTFQSVNATDARKLFKIHQRYLKFWYLYLIINLITSSIYLLGKTYSGYHILHYFMKWAKWSCGKYYHIIYCLIMLHSISSWPPL